MSNIIQHWLTEYRLNWWRFWRWKFYRRTLPICALLTSFMIILEAIFYFSTTVRLLLVITLLFTWFTVLLLPLIWTLIAVRHRIPNDFGLAKDFKKRTNGNGRLFNALELMDHSSDLAKYAIELIEKELTQLPLQNFFPKQNERLTLLRSLVVTSFILFLIVLIPNGGSAVARLLLPNTDFGHKTPYQLIWETTEKEYARNEPIEKLVRIKILTSPPPTLQGLLIVEEEGIEKVKTYPLLFIHDSASVRLEPRIGKLKLVAKLGDIESAPLELSPFNRVRLENLVYTIQPPFYSGLPPSTTSGGNISVLRGTKIDLQAQVNGRLGQLFGILNNDTIGIKIVDRIVQTSFFVHQAGLLTFVIKDEDGRNGLTPTPFNIQLLTDEIPIVHLLAPDQDMNVPGNLHFPVIARAEDDFGIQKMYLVYRFSGNRPISEWDSFPLPMQQPSPKETHQSVQTTHTTAYSGIEWDVSRFDLLPNDVIEFFVSAYDENNITGPNRGVSVLRRMLIPSLEQWFQESETLHSNLSSELQSLSQSGEQVAKSLEELAQKLKRKGELNYEEREKARGTIEKQLQLAEQIEKTAKELRELSQKLEESGAVAQQTLEKLSRLQELMDELASPELKQALKELQEALKKMDQNQIRMAMEKLQLSQKEWLEKLDRSLALLEQLRLERRLDMLEKWSKQIAEEARRQQMQIDTVRTRTQTDSLSQVNQNLSKESKSLEEQVAATAEDAKKSPYFSPEDIAEMKKATQSNRAASEALKQTSKQLQTQDYQEARASAREAAKRAESLAQKIADWNKQLREKSKQDVANKIQMRITELLQLSKQQMDLQQQYAPLDIRTPQARSFAEQQEAIRRTLNRVVDSLASLGRETFFLPRGLNAILMRADKMMAQSRNSITERIGGTQHLQEQARSALNEAAAHLLHALGELEKSNSSTGYEEMMQALAEMARRQAKLNDQTNQMMGEGGLPMPDGSPMDLQGGSVPGGTDGLLQQLAAEQGALANMMKGLEKQSERMRELTSRLQGLSDEMSEVEKQLQDKYLTERTQRLQQRILTRLLDAQRSLQKQDYTQKRESKTGQSIGGRVTTNFDPQTVENLLRSKLLELSRMGLEPIWQKRIREYWQYLEVSTQNDSIR